MPLVLAGRADELIEQRFSLLRCVSLLALLGPPGMSAFLPLLEGERTSVGQPCNEYTA